MSLKIRNPKILASNIEEFNMLMEKWDSMPDGIKEMIVSVRSNGFIFFTMNSFASEIRVPEDVVRIKYMKSDHITDDKRDENVLQCLVYTNDFAFEYPTVKKYHDVITYKQEL